MLFCFLRHETLLHIMFLYPVVEMSTRDILMGYPCHGIASVGGKGGGGGGGRVAVLLVALCYRKCCLSAYFFNVRF